jgi:hypothetical protein
VDYGVLETPASSRLVDLFKIEFIDFTIFSYYSGRKRRLAVVGLRSGAERGGAASASATLRWALARSPLLRSPEAAVVEKENPSDG